MSEEERVNLVIEVTREDAEHLLQETARGDRLFIQDSAETYWGRQFTVVEVTPRPAQWDGKTEPPPGSIVSLSRTYWEFILYRDNSKRDAEEFEDSWWYAGSDRAISWSAFLSQAEELRGSKLIIVRWGGLAENQTGV